MSHFDATTGKLDVYSLINKTRPRYKIYSVRLSYSDNMEILNSQGFYKFTVTRKFILCKVETCYSKKNPFNPLVFGNKGYCEIAASAKSLHGANFHTEKSKQYFCAMGRSHANRRRTISRFARGALERQLVFKSNRERPRCGAHSWRGCVAKARSRKDALLALFLSTPPRLLLLSPFSRVRR